MHTYGQISVTIEFGPLLHIDEYSTLRFAVRGTGDCPPFSHAPGEFVFR